jgi:hypothetical protein
VNHKENLIGRKFYRLTVIAYADDYVSPKGKHWANCLCRCDCGKTHTARACSLKSGAVKSCGCLSRERSAHRFLKHGLAHKDPLYTVWKGMRERCSNPRQTKNSPYYWSRGIRVCAEWDDFVSFRSWALSHGWNRGLQIDRVNPDMGYSPENCRCVTPSENRRNCRRRKTA